MKNTYYCKADWYGRNDLTEEDLKILWNIIVKEKLNKYVFYDKQMEYQDFKELVRNEKNSFAAVYNLDEQEPLSFFWLNNAIGEMLMMHFGIFKKGRKNKIEIGRQVIDWIVKGNIKYLIGLTPVSYSFVKKYIEDLGFKVIYTLKNACYINKDKKYIDGFVSIYEVESLIENLNEGKV